MSCQQTKFKLIKTLRKIYGAAEFSKSVNQPLQFYLEKPTGPAVFPNVTGIQGPYDDARQFSHEESQLDWGGCKKTTFAPLGSGWPAPRFALLLETSKIRRNLGAVGSAVPPPRSVSNDILLIDGTCMAATHFLPCPKCQTQATVERRHAGQFVACKNCQHSIEVPKLREFSQLATIESQSAPKSLTIPNPLRPWFFVIGLGSLVLCGIPGGLLYSYSQKMIRYGEDYTETVPPVYFNDLSQEDLWASWYDFFENKRELPPWQASSIKLTYEQGRVLKFVAYGLMGLAAAGLVMLLASFALPDRELKKRKPAGSR